MHSPCTPTTSILFPRMRRMTILDLPIKSAMLAEILQKRNVMKKEIEGSLVEFVNRAWKEGRKVREWCKDIQQILEVIPITEMLRECIRSTPIQTLIPFVNLPSNAYFPTSEPPLPPPLISTELLPNITRKQLIEALSRLSIENYNDGSRPFCDEPLIFELCLSYISTIWKAKKSESEDNLIDWLSKDLTEVEFELQLQGEPTYTTSKIIPILHKFRFQLGFVTFSQLITRFNSFSSSQNSLLFITNPTESFTSSSTENTITTNYQDEEKNTKQLETISYSWIDRRLSTGIGYQIIIEELSNIKSRIEERNHKLLIDKVLKEKFVFLKDKNKNNSELSREQSGLFWSTPSSPTTTNFETSVNSKTEPEDLYSQLKSSSTLSLSLLNFSMGRKRSLSNHTPKWLYHKRNNSSSSKLRLPSAHSRPVSGYFAGGGNNLIPESNLTSPSTVTFQFPTSTIENNLRQSVLSQRPRTTFRDDLTSSLMSLTDPEDVKTVLLNQLMEMRYHLHGHEDEGWFLGGGREQAEELLSHLEKKMIGKKDLMGLKDVFISMRSAFDLPPMINTTSKRPNTLTSSLGRETIMESRLSQKESLDLDNFLNEVAQLPDTLEENSSEEVTAGHDCVKFEEANPRYEDIDGIAVNMEEDKQDEDSLPTSLRRKSASAHSILTMASLITTDSQIEGTRLSCFEIQEAHREFHIESRAVEYHFPLPPSTPPTTYKQDWGRYERISTSVPNLSQFELEERYTRLPPKVGSLRRTRTRISQNAFKLKAKESGLDDIPSTPIYQSLALQENTQENDKTDLEDQSSSTIEPLSPASPLSPSWNSEDSPSKSTFDTHIVTPTTARHPYPHHHVHTGPLSTLSSQATLYSPHDMHFVTPDRRRASLGPVDKSRRQLHRQFAIFDGEQVSPSKELKDLGVSKETEDPITPTFKVISLRNNYTGPNASHEDMTEASDGENYKSDITPKVSTRRSNLQIYPPRQPKFSSNESLRNQSRNVSSSATSSSSKYASIQSYEPKSPVPLMEVLGLFRKFEESENGLSLWEVEDTLYRIIDIEKDRNDRLGEIWDEEKKGRVIWLIEQVAIMLGDPIYVAPISRVISSLSATPMVHSPESITLTTTFPSSSSSVSYFEPRRPSLPRYKSQPQFPSSHSSSLQTSPPRPEPIRPNILRRHTQACLSITSMESASSIYSTPSINDLRDSGIVNSKYKYQEELQEEESQEEIIDSIQCEIPLPSIGGIPVRELSESELIRENTYKKNKRLSKGYGEDWNIPLPQRMEWPIPKVNTRSFTNLTRERVKEKQRERLISKSDSESSWNSIASGGTFGMR